jgi:hydroxymethylglutaryl-CoA reductase (NADPH)
VATGQDIANVAESSAALVHTELLASGGYYYSITIPALIVATYGGGTGLPRHRRRVGAGRRLAVGRGPEAGGVDR